jgi:rod shape-determining protein MreD
MIQALPVPARVGALIFGALVVQMSIVNRIEVAGVSGDLMVVVAIAGGFHAGAERGAVIGFATGLAVDLLLTTPLGLTALVFTGVGYVSGLFAANLIRSSKLAVVALAAVAAPGAMGSWVLIGALFGQTHLFDAPLVAIMLVSSAVAAVAVVAVGPLMGRAVVDDHHSLRRAA